MSNWIILFVFLIIVSLVLSLFKKKAGKGPVDFPCQSKGPGVKPLSLIKMKMLWENTEVAFNFQ